jgi:4-hydroxybenzoate polyprenyltransferase
MRPDRRNLSDPGRQSRRRVDLRRLPRWQQYVIALTVTAAVVAAAWLVGRGEPVPGWVSGWLVPALGWLVLAVGGGALAIRLLDRLRRDRPRR